MFTRSLAALAIPPSSLSALKRAGFSSVDDLGNLSANQLSEELNIPAFICEDILNAATSTAPSVTQPAASLLRATRSSFPICKPVDNLLGDGGLKRGCVLELSGSPGSPKERMVLELVRSVVKNEGEVLFVDTQNMTLPSTLKHELRDIPGSLDFVHYLKCHSLPELMALMYGLPAFLEKHPKISLLVLNTLSFLFNTTPLSNVSKGSLLDQIKTMLAKVCASRHLNVLVTSQLATKMLSAEGSPANFDTAKKAVMVPQLGDAYLPASRTYRLMFILNSPNTGFVNIFSHCRQILTIRNVQCEKSDQTSSFTFSLRR
ncbi:hypothetical protein DFH11DRAFT_1597117 [Phellopilus nigrolimitatus]|nr:hypothetical protein DFH11DRAFT_1597117 [Phellopilus nigrolimitatus]